MNERVILPDVPFRRELASLVTIGTKFSVQIAPLDHESSPITLAFLTNHEECALEISLMQPVKQGRRARLRVASSNATAESIPVSKKVSTLTVGKGLVLAIVVKEHAFEISLDNKFIGSFVHRVHPSEISSILFDGPAICTELRVVPELPPLPAYAEIVAESRKPNESAQRDGHHRGSKDSGELFRTLYYLRHSRYSRMLKRRQSTFL